MKKYLLLLAAMFVSTGIFAQWTRPEVKTSDLVVGDTLYLYNKEAGAFYRGLGEGGSPHWGSRAGVGTEGCQQVVIQKAVYDNLGGDNASSPVTIPTEWDGESYLLQSNCSHITKPRWDETWYGLTDFGTIWTDRQNSVANNLNYFFVIEKNANGSYSIKTSAKSLDFSDPDVFSEKYIDAETGENKAVIKGGEKLGVDLSDPDLRIFIEGYNEGAALATDWYFVTPEDFAAVDMEGFKRYSTAINLREYIDANKAAYPTVDFSAAEAVYNNLASTTEELLAAKELVNQAILDYKAGEASVENPSDVTNMIVNPTFDTIGDFTGWQGSGFGAGGTTSTCAERYSMNFNTYQDIKNIPNGIYKVGVVGFYRAGSIANDWNTRDDASARHAKFYAKTGADSLYVSLPALSSWAKEGSDMGVVAADGYYVPNSMAEFTQFKEAGYGKVVSVFAPVEDNNLRIGVAKNTLIDTDWTIVDDFTLQYYGNSVEAYQYWRDDVINTVLADMQTIDWANIYYQRAAKAEFESYLEAARAATTKEEIKEKTMGITGVVEGVLGSVKAYQDYADRLYEIRLYFSEHDDLAGEDVDIVNDFIMEDGEADELLRAGELDAEGMQKALEELNTMYENAIKNGLSEGSDCTNMLVNPSFKDGFTGWTKVAGNVGGLAARPVVECYETVVDVKQEVKDIPNGIYSLSCQAFYRPAGNGNFTGEEEPFVYLYMNDFQTPVMNITKDALPEDQWQDKVNCYLNGGNADGTWPYDYNVSGYGAVPNSVDGASYAFLANRYIQKVYGLVEDGTMKIGLTSNGNKLGTAGWVLWSNFQLTYEGKSEEALDNILPKFMGDLSDYIDAHADELTQPTMDSANKVYVAAEDAADGEEKFEALSAINKAMSELKDNHAAYLAWSESFEALSNEIEVSDNAAAQEEYNNNVDRYSEVSSLTTDELKALTEEIITLTAKAKIPGELGDWTSVINNPNFDDGTANGWKYEFAAITNIGYQQNQSYTGEVDEEGNAPTCNQFIEGWRSGNAAIGNGSIEQTIAYLPAGAYTLGVDAIANLQSLDSATDDWMEKVTGVYLFVKQGDAVTKMPICSNNGKPRHFDLDFSVLTAGPVTIGVMTEDATANWLAADNWTLTAVSENPDAIEVVTSATSTATPAGIYSLSGVRMNNLQKGINIIRMADGTVKKIMK